MFLLKLLFQKLCFYLADSRGFAAIGGGGEPDGQPEPSPEPSNGNPESGEPAPATPTDFLELEGGVKISRETFDKHAKELYKDRFEAYDNREKWQAENTRRAQELKQIERDAAEYRRLMANQNQNPAQTQDPYQRAKQEYVQDMKRDFPDLDDRFLAKQFDWQMKLAGQRAQEFVNPIQEQQGMAFEEKFLAAHPKVQRGTQQYQEIADLIGAGVDADRAYQIVFHDDILKEKTDLAIKQRDEDARRKLQQSRTSGTPASQGKPKGKDAFEKNWALHGGQ